MAKNDVSKQISPKTAQSAKIVTSRLFFITGKRGSGKSCIINKLAAFFQNECTGFLTLPYEIGEKRRGFYFHSLEEVKNNDIPISVQYDEKRAWPVTETFETLGVECLEKCRQSGKKIILMDELGRFEEQAPAFLKSVWSVLDGLQPVVGVLQEGDSGYRKGIKSRADILVYHTEKDTADFIFQDIKQNLGRYFHETID